MDDFDNMTDEQLLAIYQQEKARVGGKGPPKLAPALQTQESGDIEAIQAASGISGQLGRVGSQIESGQLELGPVRNAVSSVKNFMGKSDPNSRNFASFRSTLEKLRNDSLRLNKGTQTEGDAQRAWNELVTNLNDEELVKQRLAEIDSINERAIANKRGVIQQRRQAQNVGPADLTGVDIGTIRNPYDLSGGQSRQTIPLGSFYRDRFKNVRRNDNNDTGNPKFDPKSGVQIRDAGVRSTVEKYRKKPQSGDGWTFVSVN